MVANLVILYLSFIVYLSSMSHDVSLEGKSSLHTVEVNEELIGLINMHRRGQILQKYLTKVSKEGACLISVIHVVCINF